MRLGLNPIILILIGVITAVSLYDTALIVKFQDTICAMEQNPIGLWLLALGDGDVEIFVRTKLAGTLFVASVLVFIDRYYRRASVPITASVAVYQLGLLAYLTLY